MAFNGSGVFVRLYSWVNDALAGIKIRADRMDNEMNGFATGLSTCITKDGQTTVTANLPMASFKHTGVGNASARTDYAAAGQVQDGKLNWADGGGTADAITATYSPAVTALVDGQECFVRATAANATTTPTFSPNGLTARTIVKNGNAALLAGDIAGDGHELILRYRLSDTKWELLNPVTQIILPDGAVSTSAKIVDGVVSTAKLDDGAVTAIKITDAVITYAKLAAAAFADVAAIVAGTASKLVDAATLKSYGEQYLPRKVYTSGTISGSPATVSSGAIFRSGYDYRIKWSDIGPATDNQALTLRFRDSGAQLTGASYGQNGNAIADNLGTYNSTVATGQTYLICCGAALGNLSAETSSGEILLFQPYTAKTGYVSANISARGVNTSGVPVGLQGCLGYLVAGQLVEGVDFYFPSGNFRNQGSFIIEEIAAS